MCRRIGYSEVLSCTEEEEVSKCKEEAHNMAFSVTNRNQKYLNTCLYYVQIYSKVQISENDRNKPKLHLKKIQSILNFKNGSTTPFKIFYLRISYIKIEIYKTM
jgi:hypothetical protein